MFNKRLIQSDFDKLKPRNVWRESVDGVEYLHVEFGGAHVKKLFEKDVDITFAWTKYAYGPLKLARLYEEGFVDA